MTDPLELPLIQAKVRTEPVQQRSTQRVTLLLDVAAELIDEVGIDGLTTSDVASRSESSVGVVYRYFPNIQSLLRALATRNMQQFMEKVFGLIATDSSDWREVINAAIDSFVSMNRTVPGFRALRFGDVIDERFIEGDLSNNAQLARAFAQLIAERYDITADDQLVFNFEVIVEIADALLQRAFLLDREGDDRFIAAARDIVGEYVRNNTTLPGA
ncbi:MAG: transcriptional regulator, TetR family protein [Glaciihabitans sp.]|nr:transcriptional regulator, TetR family protein [Glaciihabitans sp.]